MPKIIPDPIRFRSGGTTFKYDKSLTIPDSILRKLNKVDFFESKLRPDIVRIVNRFFDAVFVIPYGQSFGEILRKFEGEIFLRTYGLEGSRRYETVLIDLYGSEVMKEFSANKKQLWFAQAYSELAENEPEVLAERALTLPLGLPDRYWELQGTHTGVAKRVLLVCPQIATNAYYRESYEKFKKFIGEFPHLILGVQDVKVEDPNVSGYLNDQELVAAYQDSAVMYYPWRNPRHVHYTPIEAAVIGLPVVFYDDSLLARIAPEVEMGKCSNERDARLLLEMILNNDVGYSAPIVANQKLFGKKFTRVHCEQQWHEELRRTNLTASNVKSSNFGIEAKRFLLMPILRGRSTRYKVPKSEPKWIPNFWNFDESNISSLCSGVDFTNSDMPDFIRNFSGLSFAEPHGRWSDSEAIRLELNHTLPEFFQLRLKGFAHSSNAGKHMVLRVGRERYFFTLGDEASGPREVSLLVHANNKDSDIEILIPEPSMVPNDDRRIGICLQYLSIVPVQTEKIVRVKRRPAPTDKLFGVACLEGLRSTFGRTFRNVLDIERFETDELLEFSLFNSVDLSVDELPSDLLEAEGLSWAESNGRWSDSKFVVLKFSHSFPKTFTLEVSGFAYSSNKGKKIQVQIGNRKRSFSFSGDNHEIRKETLRFEHVSLTNEIRFRIPSTVKISSDSRSLGVFFSSLKMQKI